MNTPLIVPVFNQLTYLKNILNWWKWYAPNQPVYIVDNNSDYGPLLEFYVNMKYENVYLGSFGENECSKNIRRTIDGEIQGKYDYYCLSDPDISIHPSTPPNFLEIWKDYIDNKGYHHVGFNLITEGLPEWLHDREMKIRNEKEFLQNPVETSHGFIGYRAPIDTTFAMYTTKNSGWHSPMNGQDWGNSLRIFESFHLGWYQHPDYVNPEMDHYYRTAKYRVPGEPSAGKNNNKPAQYHSI